MSLVLTSAPAAEPLSVAEAKSHLRIDGAAEDALIASLILTSRLHIEAALGIALITQSWRLHLDRWTDSGVIELPIRPLQSVEAVRVMDQSGTPTTVPTSDYIVDAAGSPPRLVPVNGGWPAPGRKVGGIEIDLDAGFGAEAEDVPGPIRQALLLLVAHWYEHRDPVEIGSPETRIPAAVSDLLMPYRIKRL